MKVKCIDNANATLFGCTGLEVGKVYDADECPVRHGSIVPTWDRDHCYDIRGHGYYLKDRFAIAADPIPAPPPVHKEEKMFAKCIDASASQEILVANKVYEVRECADPAMYVLVHERSWWLKKRFVLVPDYKKEEKEAKKMSNRIKVIQSKKYRITLTDKEMSGLRTLIGQGVGGGSSLDDLHLRKLFIEMSDNKIDVLPVSFSTVAKTNGSW